jgi:hypothetical protein
VLSMERPPQSPEGGDVPDELRDGQPEQVAESSSVPGRTSFEFGFLRPGSPEGDSWDVWVIERGIAAALCEGRSIDDRTARYIATQFHDGQASALYSLASTGRIDETRLDRELAHASAEQAEQPRRWIRWLSGYCALRLSTEPVPDWSERIAAEDRQELERLRREQTSARIEELFGEQPDETIGSVDERGWFGKVRHERGPGGWILFQDEQGFRRVWETDAQQELEARWAEVLRVCRSAV